MPNPTKKVQIVGEVLKSFVRNDIEQELTEEQKLQARSNISSVSQQEVDKLSSGVAYIDLDDNDSIEIDDATSPTVDWSVNDETADGYIKNRPFYTEDPIAVNVLSGAEMSMEVDSESNTAFCYGELDMSSIDKASSFISAHVNIDGQELDLSYKENAGLFGNASIWDEGEDTGENGVIWIDTKYNEFEMCVKNFTNDIGVVSITVTVAKNIGVPVRYLSNTTTVKTYNDDDSIYTVKDVFLERLSYGRNFKNILFNHMGELVIDSGRYIITAGNITTLPSTVGSTITLNSGAKWNKMIANDDDVRIEVVLNGAWAYFRASSFKENDMYVFSSLYVASSGEIYNIRCVQTAPIADDGVPYTATITRII